MFSLSVMNGSLGIPGMIPNPIKTMEVSAIALGWIKSWAVISLPILSSEDTRVVTMPAAVEIDIESLEIGDSIHVADLLEQEPRIVTDPEVAIVNVLAPRLTIDEELSQAEGEEEAEAAEEGEGEEETAEAEDQSE